jgi:hypothetical protein
MFMVTMSHTCIPKWHERLLEGKEGMHDNPKPSQTKKIDENIETSSKYAAQ